MDTNEVTKTKILNTIKDTNKVIKTWLNSGITSDKINELDIKALFFGYVKKYIISDPVDFKRVVRILRIKTINNQISEIYSLSKGDEYFRDKFKVKIFLNLIEELEQADYLACQSLDIKKYETKQEYNNIEIDFNNIKQITF